jgi:hypothetical protein
MAKPCSSCRKLVDWAVTPAGKPMPVDADSMDQPSGNLAVKCVGGRLRCRVLKAGESPDPDEHRGMAHWATCEHADSHRKGR